MIRRPSGAINEIAKELNKHPNTISMIINTDMFQEYLARRKDQWHKEHDFALMSKVTRVAELALDSVATHLETKRDQVPLPIAVEAMTSALDRLGYGPKTAPQVSVNVDNSSRSQTVVIEGVSANALEEARQALRIAEAKRGEEYDGRLARPPAPPLIEHELAPSSADRDKQPPASNKEVVEDQGIFDLFLPKEK
jgi:IS30 family transposase